MAIPGDSQYWTKLASIVLLDLVLAGDNALVIALATRTLPPRHRTWGRVFGTLGAVVLRLLFVAAITWLLTLPLLRAIGGLVLIWIAVRLVRQPPAAESHVREGATLREAIGIIIVADLVMSFDNVLAISGAARGDFPLVVFGLLLSLPLVVWGSALLAKLMDRFPLVIWLGGGVLGWVAMRLVFEDPLVAGWLGPATGQAAQKWAPYVAGAILTVVGWRSSRAKA